MVDRIELLREMHQEANEAVCNAEHALGQARTGYASDGTVAIASAAQAVAGTARVMALFAVLLCDMLPKQPEV